MGLINGALINGVMGSMGFGGVGVVGSMGAEWSQSGAASSNCSRAPLLSAINGALIN